MSDFKRNLLVGIWIIFFILGKIFGLHMFSYDQKQKRAVLCPFKTKYCMFVAAYFILPLPIVFISVLSWLGVGGQKFVYILVYSGMFGCCIIAVIDTLVCYISHRKEIVVFLNKVGKLLKGFNCGNMYALIGQSTFTGCFINITLLTIQTVVAVIMISKQCLNSDNCYMVTLCMGLTTVSMIYINTSVAVTTYYCGTSVFKNLFRKVNDELKSIFHTSERNVLKLRPYDRTLYINIVSDKISKLFIIYGQIFTLSDQFIKFYSSQLLTIIFSESVGITGEIFSSYYATSHPSGENIDNSKVVFLAAAGLAFISCNVANFYYIVKGSNNIIKESQKTRELLRTCLLGTYCERLSKNAEIFALQLINQRVEIKPCGLFEINYANVFMAVLSISSTVFLLIQFDQEGDDDW